MGMRRGRLAMPRSILRVLRQFFTVFIMHQQLESLPVFFCSESYERLHEFESILITRRQNGAPTTVVVSNVPSEVVALTCYRDLEFSR